MHFRRKKKGSKKDKTSAKGEMPEPTPKQLSQFEKETPTPLKKEDDTQEIENDTIVEPTIPESVVQEEDPKPKSSDEEDTKEAWNAAKTHLEEVLLNKVELPCKDLDFFVETFLADDAVYSIETYQRERIGDKHLDYSLWSSSNESNSRLGRNVTFIHPLKNKVGPSHAKTNRKQQMQRFGGFGLCLQNTTRIQGVPAADCFRAEDKWILERREDGTITLTVSYHLVFEKRCMVQKIIQKNYRRETKEWYGGYLHYVKHAIMEQKHKTPKKPHLLVSEESDQQTIETTLSASFDNDDSKGNTTLGNTSEDSHENSVIATLTAQMKDLKAENARQAARIRDLEKQVLLAQGQHPQERKLFTGYYFKQLQQNIVEDYQ